MKRIIYGFFLLFSFHIGFCQDFTLAKFSESPPPRDWVDIPVGNRSIRSYVAFPRVNYQAPSVLLLHESSGLTDWVKGFADELASAGFIVIAPDLLSGLGPSGGGSSSFPSSTAARSAIYELKPSQVHSELSAVLRYVRNLPASNGKSAMLGFGWGGSQAFRFAASSSLISASFVFYGIGPKDKSFYERIRVPVYGFYGSLDRRVYSRVSLSQKYMRELGKIYEPVFYMGTGYAFMRRADSPGASSFSLEARDAAFQRLVRVLKTL